MNYEVAPPSGIPLRYDFMGVLQDAADNSGSIFDDEPLQNVQNDNDNYNVFANDSEHPEQPESINDTYLKEHGDTNITADPLDMSNNGGEVDQDEDENEDLAKERDLLASLIENLKCEIDENKYRNKLLESSNKTLVDKLKISKTKINVEIDCAKARGELISYKMSSEKSFNEYTRKLNDLNQTISEMKKRLIAHQESISIMSQEKEAQNKFYKIREDKEIEKVIALENKVEIRFIEGKFSLKIRAISADLEKFQLCLKEEMVDDLRYFNSIENEVDSLKSQLETQKTQFLNEIDRLSREYYYADHINAILGVYTTLDEFTDLQCDYVDQVVKCERLEKELSKRTENVNNKSFNELSKRFSKLEQHSINLELALQQSQEQIKNDKAWKQQESNSFRELNVKYFEIQDLKAQLQDKNIAISKPAISDSLAKKDFSNSKLVAINNVSNDLSNPVTTQILPQNVKSILKNTNLVEIILFIVDSGCSKHMTGNLKLLGNFVEKFLGTVKFGNDQIAPIVGYGDLVQGNVIIKRVYYVEGLNHNLFSVGSRGTYLYYITLQDTSTPYPICLMDKALSSQAWLWHRRLSHLNFDTINLLSKYDIVTGNSVCENVSK
ncbi:retrovirus-related pol polyprotein from transposon TNT 1-94 [Tanacetum coccineum]